MWTCRAGRLSALLNSVLDEEDEAWEHGHAAGCMIVGTRMAPDIGDGDPRVREILEQYQTDQLELITVAVKVGIADGSLRAELSPADAALLMVSAISGVRVLSQSGIPVGALRTTAALHLDALKTLSSTGRE